MGRSWAFEGFVSDCVIIEVLSVILSGPGRHPVQACVTSLTVTGVQSDSRGRDQSHSSVLSSLAGCEGEQIEKRRDREDSCSERGASAGHYRACFRVRRRPGAALTSAVTGQLPLDSQHRASVSRQSRDSRLHRLISRPPWPGHYTSPWPPARPRHSTAD